MRPGKLSYLFKANSWGKLIFISLIILQPLLVSITTFRDVLFSPGIVMHSDTVTPFDARNWITSQLYTWNEWTGQFGAHLPKIPVVLSTVMTSLALGASSELAQKIWLVSLHFSTGLLVFISIFILFNRDSQKLYDWKTFVSCSIPSLFVQLNPWVAVQAIEHSWYIFSLGALALLIAVLFRLLRKNTIKVHSNGIQNNSYQQPVLSYYSIIKYSIIISILFGLIAASPEYIIFTVLFLIVFFVYKIRSVILLKRGLALILCIAILANMYWLLSYLYYSLPNNGTNVFHLSAAQPGLTQKGLATLSGFSQMMDILSLNSFWDQDISYDLGSYALNFIWLLSGLFIILFGISFLFGKFGSFKEKEDMIFKLKDYLFFVLILLLAIILSQGTQGPLGPTSWQTLVQIPLAWTFRDPNRFVALMVLALIFLLGYVINNLIKHQTIKSSYKIILISGLIFSIFFHSWPMLTGNFNNRFVSLSPPQDYKQDIAYLKSLPNQGLVLWFPHWNGSYQWDPTQYWSGRDIGRLSTSNPVFVRNTITMKVWDFVFYNLLNQPTTKNIGKLLQALGIKYLVVHADFLSPSDNRKIKEIESKLATNRDISAVKQTKYTIILENKENADLFSTRAKNLLVYSANISAFGNVFQNYNLSSTSVIFSNKTNIGIPIDYAYSGNTNTNYYYDHSPISEPSAQIIDYKKIDPTKYLVKVNATRPYMLVFAESYDPLWYARINSDHDSGGYKSLELYSAINGFWITKTGTYELEITYQPQEWSIIGIIISVITLSASIGYLILGRTKVPARAV